MGGRGTLPAKCSMEIGLVASEAAGFGTICSQALMPRELYLLVTHQSCLAQTRPRHCWLQEGITQPRVRILGGTRSTTTASIEDGNAEADEKERKGDFAALVR